jgi:hypothetical protein
VEWMFLKGINPIRSKDGRIDKLAMMKTKKRQFALKIEPKLS